MTSKTLTKHDADDLRFERNLRSDFTVTNMNGLVWNIRIIAPGDRYGRDGCLVNDDDKHLVEFYDARFKSEGHTNIGQFVTRYRAASIIADLADRGGLDLDHGILDWTVDSHSMQLVRPFLLGFLRARGEL